MRLIFMFNGAGAGFRRNRRTPCNESDVAAVVFIVGGRGQGHAMAPAGPYDLIRPFLWIALVAFLCGFSGYVVLAAVQAPQRAQVEDARWLKTAEDAGPARAV
jgi:hypothetical protein